MIAPAVICNMIRSRGASSSAANRVQYEAFSKCLRKFDFTKYKGKVVNINVNAGNPHVTEQIKTLVNVNFVKNSYLLPRRNTIMARNYRQI